MKKAGILGGGQLGRMLLQEAANYAVITHILEKDIDCPAAHLCHHFTQGDITTFEDVYNFGKNLDVITIEIENVNTEALEKLEKEGVTIIPKPSVLKVLQNKIQQKEFYKNNGITSSEFAITYNKKEIDQHKSLFPAVHKAALGGYDGRGVQILQDASDADKGFDNPAILEKLVDIKQEISIIVAVSTTGEIKIYPPVEMIFDPLLNLLSHQIFPAVLSNTILWKAEALALNLVKAFNSPGIFAIEFFIDKQDNVLVNETAPRVHNSGHQTIEASYSSQFDMLWRIMLNYPLGNTESIMPAAMVNIIGEEGFSGPAFYRGIEEVLSMDNVFVHLYGKKTTHPGRKMGHVTILSNEKQELIHKCNQIKRTIFAESK